MRLAGGKGGDERQRVQHLHGGISPDMVVEETLCYGVAADRGNGSRTCYTVIVRP